MAAYKSSAQGLIYPEPAPRTRNHHKQNLREIRNKQVRMRQQKLEAEARRQRPQFKNKAYEGVAPRVDRSGHAPANRAAAAQRAPAQHRDFLRAGARKAKGAPERPVEPYARQHKSKHAPVPRAAELAVGAAAVRKGRAERDFEKQQLEDLRQLQEKQRKKQQQQQARRERTNESTKDNGQFGKVPEYLAQRRVELEEEKQYLQNMARQTVALPHGWQQMPDQQRENILRQLTETFDKKNQALQRMPLLCEGVSRRRAKVQPLHCTCFLYPPALVALSPPTFPPPWVVGADAVQLAHCID
jgi:hypothetical protein